MTNLSEPVSEIVLEVSNDGPPAVLQQAHLGPLPRPGEVRLQRTCNSKRRFEP